MPLFNHLVPIKWTCLFSFSFDLAFKRSSLFVTMRVVNKGIISK